MRTTVPAAQASVSERAREPDAEREAGRLGALLQHYRRRAGLTQTQLADFSTISVRAIRDLEAGRARQPRRDTVRLLADALRLSDERRASLEAAAGRGSVGAAVRSAEAAAAPFAPPLAAGGPLLGRDDETRMLYELLAAGQDRLVAVVGLSGVGKSRLTLAVAQALHSRLHMSVLWLAAEGRDAHGLRQIRPDQAAQPWLRELLEKPDDAVDDLAAFIGDRSFLLVLDGQQSGLKRAISGNPRAAVTAREPFLSADAQLTLLARCPKLRIVSTLRTADVSASSLLGQRTLRLSPLAAAADATDSVSAPAAQLLHWHMRQLRPHWQATQRDHEAISALSRSLDGIPLALESAAAWSLVLAPTRLAAIAARDPFALTSPPADRARTRSDPIRAGLTDAIAALTPQAKRVLSLVSRWPQWPQPWTLDQVAARSGYGFSDVSRAAHGLLVHDLIRAAQPEGGGDAPEVFTVLHLVRHLVRGPAQQQLSGAYVRPIGFTAQAATPVSALTRR